MSLLFDQHSSSDSGSDDEEEEEKEQNIRESVQDTINRIIKGLQSGTKTAWDFETDWDWLAEAKDEGERENALHFIAKHNAKRLAENDTALEDMIQRLVEHKNDLLSKQNQWGYTPLLRAIEMKKETLVRWMCKYHRDVGPILSITNTQAKKQRNCIDATIDKRLKGLPELIDKANADTLAAKGANGNTPLHRAVDYKKCREGQLDIVSMTAEKGDAAIRAKTAGNFNYAQQPPYLYHQFTKQRELSKGKEPEVKTGNIVLIHHKKKDEKDKLEEPLRPPINLNDRVGIHTPSKPQEDAHKRQRSKLLHVPIVDKYGNRSGARHDLAQKVAPSPGRDTPPEPSIRTRPDIHPPQSKEKHAGTKTRSKADEQVAKDIEEFLQLHYVRSRSYEACREILYGIDTPSDIELCFDLSGYRDDKLRMTEKEFRTSVIDKLKFNEVLQYITIPNLPFITQRSTQIVRSDAIGRDDLAIVFDCLRKRGVKTILQVIVGDTNIASDRVEGPIIHPHTDEAIEEALRGFGVEVWDWKKPDICSEVIFNVAPDVRELHLYWYGNNGVLRGWGEPDGIRKLSRLARVYLHVEQICCLSPFRLESASRTDTYTDAFSARITNASELKVDVLNPLSRRHSLMTAVTRSSKGQAKQHTKDEWIRCMERFRTVLVDAELNFTRNGGIDSATSLKTILGPGIKVALIDDGVDYSELPQCTFAGGLSFSTLDKERGLINPYYFSAGGHGTSMARHIHFMCPGAEIYVLRLEDHHDLENLNGRQIAANSAAKAIHAAVRKKVDIISMSWTIAPTGFARVDQSLESAVRSAAEAGILMFCSAADRGANQHVTYPSKAAPGKIFTIGAASQYGSTLESVGSVEGISFTLPGEKVTVPGSERAQPGFREPTGSSVATALGAGLAALILYCVKVHLFLAKPAEKERIRTDLDMLRKHENMLKAINGIGSTIDMKFVMVWQVFGKVVEQQEKKGGSDDMLELVSEAGRILCTKLL